jgi:hypothetical protein
MNIYDVKTYENSLKTGRNCGWSETQQQHSDYETKRTVKNHWKNWQNCGWSATQQQHSEKETKRTVVL